MSDVKVVDIRFTIRGRVFLDVARAEEDPWWEQYTKKYDLTDPEQFEFAVRDYVTAYLLQENFLSNNAPWTCGPADIHSISIDLTKPIKAENTNGGADGN